MTNRFHVLLRATAVAAATGVGGVYATVPGLADDMTVEVRDRRGPRGAHVPLEEYHRERRQLEGSHHPRRRGEGGGAGRHPCPVCTAKFVRAGR